MSSSIKLLVIVLFVSMIAGIILFFLNGRARENLQNPLPIQTKTQNSDTQLVTLVSEKTAEVHSPDGAMNLLMEKIVTSNNSTYAFKVVNIETGATSTLFTKQVPEGSVMQISQNAWSPDNKYLFIKEVGSGSMNFLVFKADGAVFSQGEQYIDVVAQFTARDTGYSISDITGWDSETLLHILTQTENGEKGPNFWFEIPSKAVIRLAR